MYWQKNLGFVKIKFGLSQRIYASMLLLMFITFLLVAFFSAMYFKKQNEEYHYSRILRKQQSVLASVNYFFTEERDSEFFPFYTKEFADKIEEFSVINDIDIIIYDVDGELLTSSFLETSQGNTAPLKLDSKILDRLSHGESSFITDEIIEDIDKLSSFTYLTNQEGASIAVIALPYSFATGESVQEFVKFLNNLIIIFAIVFPLGLLIAFFISRNITKPLKALGISIKNLNLEKENYTLQWTDDDVIGALISQYNQKVKELEESAKLLAQSERESAWREMAKQVAHEIKNPLTPMKLSVQYIQRSWQSNPENFQEKLTEFTNTMIEQIDTLAYIASEFSNFAKLPKAIPQKVDVGAALLKTKLLFEKESDIQIQCNGIYENQLFVFADPNHLRRVLNNLVQNAYQSMFESENKTIILHCEELMNKVIISIKDYGSGIPEELKSKIFAPNFSTKSDGMGLGLAMVKNMVNSNNGEIYFETEVGAGSVFYVKLPKFLT